MINLTRAAMEAAGPQGRLRGVLFTEGEGTAMPIWNNPIPIWPSWASDFTKMVTGMRSALSAYNPNLAVLLGVQRVDGRDTIFPYISQIKQQQQDIVLPNLMKSQMEPKQFFAANYGWACGNPADLDLICGGRVIGDQLIHLTKWGEVSLEERVRLNLAGCRAGILVCK